jgi:hypothetical protein
MVAPVPVQLGIVALLRGLDDAGDDAGDDWFRRLAHRTERDVEGDGGELILVRRGALAPFAPVGLTDPMGDGDDQEVEIPERVFGEVKARPSG